jgi:cytochrome c biogenesis protein CcmG/thiol:disulfide interchange protein DsbE
MDPRSEPSEAARRECRPGRAGPDPATAPPPGRRPPGGRRLWRGAAIVARVAALLGLLAYGFQTDPRGIPSPLLGRPARPFSLQPPDGGRFVLAAHASRAVGVNSWASWCVPCREEAPLLFAIPYPDGPDPGGRLAIDYDVYGIPETFFVTPDGRIASKPIGAIGARTMVTRIEEALRGVVSADAGRRRSGHPVTERSRPCLRTADASIDRA